MAKYLVTLRNGHKFTIDADSPAEAKSIVQARLDSMRAHARSKPVKDEYRELANTSTMNAESVVGHSR